MYPTAEPFLGAEIDYRRERIAGDFKRHPRRRPHRSLRGRHLRLRKPGRGDGADA